MLLGSCRCGCCIFGFLVSILLLLTGHKWRFIDLPLEQQCCCFLAFVWILVVFLLVLHFSEGRLLWGGQLDYNSNSAAAFPSQLPSFAFSGKIVCLDSLKSFSVMAQLEYIVSLRCSGGSSKLFYIIHLSIYTQIGCWNVTNGQVDPECCHVHGPCRTWW